MTEQQRLHHLLDRARRGVILPAEGEQLAALVGELEARIVTLEAVCLSNKRAYAGAVQAAWTAEARVTELEAEVAGWKARFERVQGRVAELEIEAVATRSTVDQPPADDTNNKLMEEVQRYAAGDEHPVLWSVYNKMHGRALTAEARVRELEARIATLEHVAAGNKRHVQLIVPDLEKAAARVTELEAEVARPWGDRHGPTPEEAAVAVRSALPHVQGRCPACGNERLFLGDGGHVTCPRIDCPNPTGADDLLHNRAPDWATKPATAETTEV